MKFLKYLLFIILIAIIGMAIYIAVQPNEFEVKRTRTIKAPAKVIYNQVIDFKNWEAWSPWLEKDPTTKLTYAEKTKGVDGAYSWEDKDGVGNMKTIGAREFSDIEQELQFADYTPSKITWKFTPTEDGQTQVTWKMNSDNIPFMFKGFAAFMGGFDKMIGPDFERGLEKLDSLSTAKLKEYSIKVNGLTQHGGGYYIYTTASCRIDDIKNKIPEMMPKVGAFAANNNISQAGMPFTLYHDWNEEQGTVILSCCIPTTEKIIIPEGDILTGQLEPFKAVKTTLKGDYNNLSEAWEKTMTYVEQYNLEFADKHTMVESYVTDPGKEPNPAEWMTELFIAVK
ncbi:SRPBCC family protein [Mangrovimonas spongiae]|uniref:Transcription activator effector-binding protein n=1 Tax=Mangrovimonas spongiae TaxID=2494697 RepID=A0A428K2U0_9FLAO|nr:SRPBCC family protein [Mangrovimonas spongiae]RSK40739.1 transcription activator effector-binding protein [Mangrovimonas spongiae]